MTLLRKFGRLFIIKTRFEAWFVIYAIALGAVERASAYLTAYPGWLGWTFAAACSGVVFVAGSKLLDSVTPAKPALGRGPIPASRAPSVRHRLVVVGLGSGRLVDPQIQGFDDA